MVNGEHYVIALLPPVDYTMPDTMQQTQLTLADGSLVTAYQETQEEGSEVESEFYTFYGVNSDGTEGWYQYDSIEETYQRVNTGTTVSSDGLQDEDAAYLQEEYLALSEKYKKEKAFSRTAIGVLIFLLAVMAVVLINLLLHRRGGDEEDLEDDDDIIDDAADESNETAGTGKLPEKTPEDAEESDDLTYTRMRTTLRRKSRRRRDSVSGSGSLTIWMTICLMMTRMRMRMRTRTGTTMTRTRTAMRRTMKKFRAAKKRLPRANRRAMAEPQEEKSAGPGQRTKMQRTNRRMSHCMRKSTRRRKRAAKTRKTSKTMSWIS